MTLVFMFPGQSSRYPEMISRIAKLWSPADRIIGEASQLLARDLRQHYHPANKDQFSCNQHVQVGVFLASYLHQKALEDHGIQADVSLGLSLGEYNHLVHIGALDFYEALKLVDARGKAYDQGPDGMMAGIFPVSAEELEPYLEAAKRFGTVEIASYNSPSQSVIAGERKAVEEVIRLVDEEGMGAQIVVIEQKIPMHTSHFKPVAAALKPYLQQAPCKTPVKSYLPNVLAEARRNPSEKEIITMLERHVYQPVQWRRSIEYLSAQYENACFIEVGPAAVLFNLLQKSWLKRPKFRTDNGGELSANFSSIISELTHAA